MTSDCVPLGDPGCVASRAPIARSSAFQESLTGQGPETDHQLPAARPPGRAGSDVTPPSTADALTAQGQR